MEIVRLTYCEHSYKGIYQLVNIDGDYYWRKNNFLRRDIWASDILPLYISAKDNRYLSFCQGFNIIRFVEGDI